MPLTLVINGQNRVFAGLTSPAMLSQVIKEMELKGDRIAVEHNGEIAQRVRWVEIPVSAGDRLEVVHFVGGGGCKRARRKGRGSGDWFWLIALGEEAARFQRTK
jgi:sulfur carrier protein